VLLWAALTIVGALAWYLFTGRTVEIVVEPTPDRIEIKGRWPSISVDGRHFLHPGDYRVEAELAGHRPLTEPIRIDRRAGGPFHFAFEPLPGRLRVSTGELTGAEVIVDGEVRATTPAEIELAQGEHAVVLRAQRHAEATHRVVVTEPDQRIDLDVVLLPAWAPVTIRSTPTGAEVVANGHLLGSTPLTAELGAGRHDIEVRMAGYAPHRSPITVVAGKALALPTIRLNRAAARLTVTTEPPGASVTVDDVFQGVTPIEISLAPDREHELTLSKGGFELHTREVELGAGSREHLTVELNPLLGMVRFTSRPTGAEVLVNGQPRGRTDLELELAEQTYQVELRLPGHLPHTTMITPRSGTIGRVEAVLLSEEAAARKPPTVTSPQGVELKLIEGGRFTAGASRRVPGRRANETLRKIEITRPYYLAVREVSNREFREFSKGHRSGGIGSTNLEIDHHPVVRVSWDDAARYCNWLSEKESLPPVYAERNGAMVPRSPPPAGYRLPTEAEWAWAARFDERGDARKYGWGNELPIPSKAGNFGDRTADPILGDSIPNYDDGFAGTAPVGSFRPNQRGLFNMGGNVSEWVQDLYTIYPPSGAAPVVDPSGPDEGEYHVIRGASWMDDTVTELRLSYRDYSDEARPDVGFRIARSAD
jgi:formylglycine-generating enzyme required for sulfatase activity